MLPNPLVARSNSGKTGWLALRIRRLELGPHRDRADQ
jgi:hypothetical protein